MYLFICKVKCVFIIIVSGIPIEKVNFLGLSDTFLSASWSKISNLQYQKSGKKTIGTIFSLVGLEDSNL